MTITEDCELLRFILRGDREALVILYDRYSPVVYTVALRILKSPASAEDVLQELFLQLWVSPNQIEIWKGSLYGWMVVASRNRSISALRRRQPVSLNGVDVASTLRPNEHAERKLMCERLINSVPVEIQALLKMAFYQDMSYSEIATSTGIPLGTVKTRMRAGLTSMKKSVASHALCPALLPDVALPLLVRQG